ncbi:MAG: energy transducer TonB [Gammaproteobacteria bacterium]
MRSAGLGTNTVVSDWVTPGSRADMARAVHPQGVVALADWPHRSLQSRTNETTADVWRVLFALFITVSTHSWLLAQGLTIQPRVPTAPTEGMALAIALISKPQTAEIETEKVERVEEPVATVIPEVAAPVSEPIMEEVVEVVEQTPPPPPVIPVEHKQAAKPKPKPRIERPVRDPAPQVTKEPPKVVRKPPEKIASQPSVAVADVQIQKPKLVLEPTYRRPPPPPHYPRRARRLGQQGTVVLQALVDERGLTRSVRVVKSSGFELLDNAARQSVAKWEFVPAQEAGRGVKFWVQIPVTFRLR